MSKASEKLKVGETYNVQDFRKGTFVGKLVSQDGEWMEFEIVEGRARYITRPDAVVGDTVTCRNSLCRVTKQAVSP